MITDREIIDTLERGLPGFHPQGPLKALEGGNLNHICRLQGEERSVIVKVALPHIATNPEVPLSPKRIQFEANALQLFQEGNLLYQLVSKKVRPPRGLFFDQQKNLLVMEDFGHLPDIAQAMKTQSKQADFGWLLGTFIGRLHKETYQRNDLANQFNNIDIQQTRLNVQYKSAADYAREGGVQSLGVIRQKTEALGQRLLSAGKCLVMGDLWPESILIENGNLRIIDWEFCHYGRPLQDIGHFAAHCWMQAQTSSSNKTTEHFEHLWNSFWEGYQDVLGESFPKFIDYQEMDGIATHLGAEILIRATGPFKDGYVYQSLSTDDLQIREATQKAINLITADDFSSLWD